MSWTCKNCQIELRDDVGACPECAASKSSWTVLEDLTRTFVVSRRKNFDVVRGVSTTPTPEADPAPVEFAPCERVQALPKSVVRDLAARAHRPAPAHLVYVVWKGGKSSSEVELVVDFEQQAAADLAFPAQVSEEGGAGAAFLFVHGHGSIEGIAFPGIHLVDLTDDTEAGVALEVEVSALGRPPQELPVERLDQVVACASIPGVTFRFGTSFVGPDVVDSLKEIEALADRHHQAKIQVFGHTDRVDDDAFNKRLSERRAWSAFAFITNDVAAWETLYNHPDESWGLKVVQEILADLGLYEGTIDGDLGSGTRGAMRSLLGLAEDAPVKNDAALREVLFARYMGSKHDVDLGPERFMQPGYMGCGEFNPVDEASGKSEPNRRVRFVFFHPELLPVLPCAFDDVSPCQAQMDSGPRCTATFRCAYYDSLACQCRPEPAPLLFDFEYRRSEAGVEFAFTVVGEEFTPPLLVQLFEVSSLLAATDRRAQILERAGALDGAGLRKSGLHHLASGSETGPAFAAAAGVELSVLTQHPENRRVRDLLLGVEPIPAGTPVYVPQQRADTPLPLGPALPAERLEDEPGQRYAATWDIASNGFNPLEVVNWYPEASVGGRPLEDGFQTQETDPGHEGLIWPQFAVLDAEGRALDAAPAPPELVGLADYADLGGTDTLSVLLGDGTTRHLDATSGTEDFGRTQAPITFFGALLGGASGD